MSPRTVERVDDWETVPFGGGYSGLRDLASQEFSGVVTAGPTRLFMIRGTAVGVLDGSIDDFEDSGGNAREAPHPALPLLAVMQERSDEVRAKYYTEDTPISDVDRTLSDGSFTGYVELSENVLSGDYYQVYHQGRSMSVAYVGSSERLITDDEAFEQADDEVGIYEVRPVEIEAIDIPEPAEDAADGTDTDVAGGTASATAAADGAESDPGSEEAPEDDADTVSVPSAPAGTDEPETSESEPRESAAAVEPDEPVEGPDESTTDASRGTASTSAEESTTASTGEADADPTGDDSSTERDPDDVHPGAAASRQQSSTSPQPSSDQETDTGSRASQSRDAGGDTQARRTAAESEPSRSSSDAASTQSEPTRTDRTQSEPSGTGDAQPTPSSPGSQNGGQRSSTPASAGSAADLETRSIPSLDPARTKAASKAQAKRKSGGRNGGTAQPSQSQRTQGSQQRSSDSRDQSTASQTSGRSTPEEQQSSQRQSEQSSARQSPEADRSPADQRDDAAEATRREATTGADASDPAAELESREQEIEDLRTDLERVEAERDELETERADLEAERDRLQAELEEARAEIERLEERLEDFAAEGASAAETQLSAGEAIDNTNLFVRYRSKGDATLETAHSGNADRSEVAENMRLEYHTQFDADSAAVGNESFDDFLTGTIQYRFVDWIIGSLLYEVRDTGHADGMADLYNALPKIDRAELNGQVSVSYTEDGEEHRSQERFDVVVRDRMGNPLMVANINNSRDPATDAMMTDLVKRAERVGASSESLAAAFLVTESFFEPEALETADGATSSGLFSRDKRKSFVNLSRKDGYHLCLVEARNQEFHLAVPEL